MEVTGHYLMRNDTRAPIREVHVRQADGTDFTKLELAGATLASEDAAFFTTNNFAHLSAYWRR